LLLFTQQNHDDAYEKMLTQHSNDITTLVDRMQEQYSKLMQSYELEMLAVEKAFDEERAATILVGSVSAVRAWK